jgi:phage terminase Nu1 subunit (DNA packaging protein)
MSAERFVDKKEIAFLLEVSPRTITNWVGKHSDFPSRLEGNSREFPVLRCLAWQRDRAVADALTSAGPAQPTDMYDAELRKAKADAELAEVRLARLRGELITVESAASEIERAFSRVRARFLSVPGEYGPQMLRLERLPDAIHKLRDLVGHVLSELQSGLGEDDDDDEPADGPSSSGAAEAA